MDGWGNVSAASNVFDVAAAIQKEHMCAGRPSLAHTWGRATVNHVCACESVSGFEQRRGLLRVQRADGRTDGRREKSLALLRLRGAPTRPRFNLAVPPQREIEEKKTREEEEGRKEGGRREEGGGRPRGPGEKPRLTAARARLIFTLHCLYF